MLFIDSIWRSRLLDAFECKKDLARILAWATSGPYHDRVHLDGGNHAAKWSKSWHGQAMPLVWPCYPLQLWNSSSGANTARPCSLAWLWRASALIIRKKLYFFSQQPMTKSSPKAIKKRPQDPQPRGHRRIAKARAKDTRVGDSNLIWRAATERRLRYYPERSEIQSIDDIWFLRNLFIMYIFCNSFME